MESPLSSRIEPGPKRKRSQELPSSSTSHLSSEEVRPQEPVQETEAMEVREAEEDVEVSPSEPTKECASCLVLQNDKRQLKNAVNTLRDKLKDKRDELTRIKKTLEGRSCSWAGYLNVCGNIHVVFFIGAILNSRQKYMKWREMYCFIIIRKEFIRNAVPEANLCKN